MRNLKDDFKTLRFKRVYLIYGEERFLVEHYANGFTEKLLSADSLLMNRDVFDGKDVTADKIIGAAETLPFLAEYRLVYVRDSRLFTAGRKQESEAIADYLPDIPETSILIFIETDVDKRNRLYKKTAELGRAADCVSPSEGELITWAGKVFQKMGKTISRDVAQKLLRTVMRDMTALYAEAGKLSDYTGERAEITARDIEAVCSPSLETRVFDLVAAIGDGKTGDALRMYRNLLQMKESPVMILSLMARQFRLILQCKDAGEHAPGFTGSAFRRPSPYEIGKELNLRGFVVEECLRQGKRFTEERLLAALSDCEDTDIRMKTGLVQQETGVEVLIVRYGAS
ncbi:MAG: DNA polymerase III subunit delta [Clostridiales bacterium]|jgi:DNA polymerase-3 subunit delta|nr:DNA polymerase III subunit delta [Clostridiales bacterium]